MTIFSLPHIPTLADDKATSLSAVGSAVKLVLFVMLLGLVLRAGLFAVSGWQDPSRAMVGDSQRYLDLGHNLATTGAFGLAEEDSGLVHIPLSRLRDGLGQGPAEVATGIYAEGFRTPGYPALLAIFDLLGLGLHSVLLMQVILGALTIGLVGWIAWMVTHRAKVAAAAALLFAVNPGSIVECNLILSECLFTFLLTLSIALLLYTRRTGRWQPVALLGVTVAAAALVRPIAIVIIPLAGVVLLLPYRRIAESAADVLSPGLGRRVAYALLFGALVALPLSGWIARNHAVGYGPKLSTVPDVNAWFYTAAYLDLTKQGKDHSADWPEAVEQQMATLTASASVDQSVYSTARELATQRIGQDPALYATLLARSGVKFFTDHSMTEVGGLTGKPWESTGLRSRVLSGDVGALLANPLMLVPLAWMLFNLAFLLTALTGVIVFWRRGRRVEVLFLSLVIAGFVFATQTNGLERFRWPIAPVQAVLAGAGTLALMRYRVEKPEEAER
ncbi:MAG: phospholipid carrier-dependent glycosyltransferase [Planctomycetota bacterium]